MSSVLLGRAPALVLSQPLPYDMVVYRGDTGRFRVTVTDPEGLPVDVALATWDCEVRASHDAATPLAVLDVTPVPGTPSAVDVVLDPADSALLAATSPPPVWDLQMTLDGTVQTLLAGKVCVSRDVSR
jgi:hypothetical protein